MKSKLLYKLMNWLDKNRKPKPSADDHQAKAEKIVQKRKLDLNASTMYKDLTHPERVKKEQVEPLPRLYSANIGLYTYDDLWRFKDFVLFLKRKNNVIVRVRSENLLTPDSFEITKKDMDLVSTSVTTYIESENMFDFITRNGPPNLQTHIRLEENRVNIAISRHINSMFVDGSDGTWNYIEHKRMIVLDNYISQSGAFHTTQSLLELHKLISSNASSKMYINALHEKNCF